jgi:2-polyprenyl-3-methyl-5-hydroxy-6-metoxy-1,4-benzoquinol methylase
MQDKPENLDGVRHRFEWDADNFAAIYRLERSVLSRTFNRVFRKAIFERYEVTFCEAGDVKGRSVLDIGCGSGVYSVDFARRGVARALGLDFSNNMIELARREAKQHGVEAVCEFQLGDFLSLQLEEKFDVVFAMGVFDYLSDPVPFLRKMHQASRGKTIASFPGHSLVREPLRRLRYQVTRRGDVHFYDEGDVRRLAEEAGLGSFQVIRVTSSGGGYILVGAAAP